MTAQDYQEIYERLKMPVKEITKNLDSYLEQSKIDINNLFMHRAKLIGMYTDTKVKFANDWIIKNAPEEVSKLIEIGFEIERNRNHEISILLKLNDVVCSQSEKTIKDVYSNKFKNRGFNSFLFGMIFCVAVNLVVSWFLKH